MKKIISVLAAIVFMFAFSSVAFAQITKDQYYARSFLSGNELEFYDERYDSFANGSTVRNGNFGLSEERAKEIVNYVWGDSPELFRRNKLYTDEKAQELQNQIDIITADILKNVTEDMTDYEKVKFIYSYLGKNIFYGYGSSSRDDKTVYETQTIVGGLINKTAICGGISSTLQYLLYQIDIPSYMVEATTNNGAHGLNIIQIDGQWYYADLTRDIANVKRNDPWEGFLISEETLHSQGTYANAADPPLPECPSDYIEPTPKPTPKPTPQPTIAPVKASIQPEPTEAPEPEEAETSPAIWVIAAGAAAVILLLVRRKRKA